jgi:hypothetical protein
VAALIIDAVLVYAVIGAALALIFLLWGIDRIDPAATGAYAFRPLLFPGMVLLWPLVAARWIALERRRHRATHRIVWVILAVLLPVILIGAMSIRRDGPLEAPAIRLAAPR